MRTDSSTETQPHAVVDGRNIAHERGARIGNAPATDQPSARHSVGGHEVILGVLVLVAWVILFTAGLMVGTQEYRDHLGQPQRITWQHLLADSFIVLTCFTYTNIVLLCCLAGLLGQVGYRTCMLGSERNPLRGDGRTHYSAALIRGFVVYLVLMSGEVLLRADSFTSPNQMDYLKVATAATLLSLMVGYDPHRLIALLRHTDETAQTRLVPGDRANGSARNPRATTPQTAHQPEDAD